jgi:hypothetical protein
VVVLELEESLPPSSPNTTTRIAQQYQPTEIIKPGSKRQGCLVKEGKANQEQHQQHQVKYQHLSMLLIVPFAILPPISLQRLELMAIIIMASTINSINARILRYEVGVLVSLQRLQQTLISTPQ